MSSSTSINKAVQTTSSKKILERLLNAIKQVETVAAASDEAKAQFQSNYKDAFGDLFVKVFVHSRERNELKFIQDMLETSFKAALPEVPLPKVPERKKPLVIFPETSFEDVLALIPKNMQNSANLVTIGKYLQTNVNATKPKRIKASKYKESIKQVLDTKPQPIIKELFESIVEACDKKIVESAAEEDVKRAAEERMKDRLKKVEKPNAAQQRAIATLTKKTGGPSSGISSALKDGKASSSTTTVTSAGNRKPLPSKDAKKQPLTASSTSGKKPEAKKKKRPMTDAEFERAFLKRARETSLLADLEEENSRRIGAREDAEAVL